MFDFNEITGKSTLYNLHSHTQYCDGHAPMADFARAAAEAGFTDYGYSPHAPITIESPCNMKRDDVDCYLAEFQRLKSEYSGRLRLYASMEIDYLDDDFGPHNEYFAALPLDYRIGSVHFVPCGDGYVDTDGRFESFRTKMETFFDNDIHAVVDSFYDQEIKMIESGGFDLIGHFDKIGLNASLFCRGIEDEDWYRRHVTTVMEAIKDTHLTAEINTKSFATYGRTFPHQRYFSCLKSMEIPVVFNSDAHVPELINAGREEAMKIYNKI